MKDIELYALIPDGKYRWRIVNEDNIFIVDINDYDIEGICEGIRINNYIEKYSAEEFIERVWKELRDGFSPAINHCEWCGNWNKFCAWVDYISIEFLGDRTVALYKQRLLDFE